MTRVETNYEPLSVLIPVRNVEVTIVPAITAWCVTLDRIGHGWELILVDDGSTDATRTRAEELAAKQPAIRVMSHQSACGFGACLRTALAESPHPLVFYTSLDYPYTPADLRNLLARIDQTDDYFQRKLDLVNGCRTGLRPPAFWKAIGFVYRLFCRVALGLPLQPAPGWLGFRNHLRSWWAWPLLGIPVVDTGSAFKLFRRSLLDRFPIQSDGGFVHAELLAKCTFLSSKGHEVLMDELPLSPQAAPIPVEEWKGLGTVLRQAEFHAPAAASAPVTPSDSAPVPTPA